jgi:hypothetical protein
MKRNAPMHPKTLALASMLGIRRFEACGLLELMWHFTAQYCPRGDIGKRTDPQIAAALDWPQDKASEMIEAMVVCGWLDRHDEHRLIVHDWHDHADGTCDRYLDQHGFTYASGRAPRRQNRNSDDEMRADAGSCAQLRAVAGSCAQMPASRPRARVPEPEPESESEGVRCAHMPALTHQPSPDAVHRTLIAAPMLRGLTLEADLRARQSAGFRIDDPALEGLAERAAADSVMMTTIRDPGVWWRKQLMVARDSAEKEKVAAPDQAPRVWGSSEDAEGDSDVP